MSRYIDAEWLKELYKPYESYNGKELAVPIGAILANIDDAPSIAIEPKRGAWITIDTEVISVPVYWNEKQKESDERGAGIQEKCKCSACGWITNFVGYKKLGVNKSFNFCPNCGAKMKGADDGVDDV